MAEQSKFAGALGRLKQPPLKTETPDAAPRPEITKPATARTTPVQTPKAGRGGKRSDPEYSPTTFFVRKETKRKAAQLLLEEANADKDLSDIVEELLAKWVAKHSNA